jgi:hypothetical protein
VKSLFKKLFKSRKAAPARRKSVPLAVESLEDRQVPTIVFRPHFGEQTLRAGSQNIGLQDPPVYLLFWGPYWGTAQGQQDQRAMSNAVSSILSGPYLSKLTQYGSDGRALYDNSWADVSDPSKFKDPVTSAGRPSSAAIEDYLNSVVDQPVSPIWLASPHEDANPPIYVVVTDPNYSKDNGGWNAPGTFNYTVNGNPASDTLNMVWAGTATGSDGRVDMDSFTLTLSHEIAERMSDPQAGGIEVDPGKDLPSSLHDPNGNQIGDNEPAPDKQPHYGYRLNGYLVQPYWSAADRAFVVPDGNAQKFTLDPLWSSSQADSFLNRYRPDGSWRNIDGANDVLGVAIDSNDTLYALKDDHSVWRYDGGGKWFNATPAAGDTTPAGGVGSIAVDASGQLFALSFNNHAVWRYDGGVSWTDVTPFPDKNNPGDNIASMAVDDQGNLLALSFADHTVWQYSDVDASWTKAFPGDNVASIVEGVVRTVDANGVQVSTGSVYELTFDNHNVWRYDGGTSWTYADPVDDVQSIAVDKTGSLYALSFANHGVWRYDGGTSWTNVDPVNDVQSIAVDKTGSLYALSFANHGVWQYLGGTSWADVDRTFVSPITHARVTIDDIQSIAVDKTGTLYGLSSDNNAVLRYDGGTSWVDVDRTFVNRITNARVTIDDAQSIAVDKTGTLYALSSGNHGVWRYDGGTSWTNVDPADDVQSIGVDKKGDLYALSFLDHGVRRYDGGTNWTNVRSLGDVQTMVVDNQGELYVLSFDHRVDRLAYDYVSGRDGGWDTVYPDKVARISLDKTGALSVTFFDQGINGTALSSTGLWVDGNYHDASAPFDVQLMPGQHYVYAQGVFTYFTVNADGTIDYDASLDGALAGRGTTSLSLLGRAVALDASALGVSAVAVDGTWLDVAGPLALRLMPGQHYVYAQGVFTYFTVNADGTLDYDASLDGALSGRGTTSLSLLGRAVALDVSALGVSAVAVDGVWHDLAGPMALQLMPGQHYVYAQGVFTYFTVNADGTLDYDASLDGALAGRGTTDLSLIGRAVTVDASALGVSAANVDGVWHDLAGPMALQLMPGAHYVYVQGVYAVFTVNADGTLDYDASLDGALTGRGTTTLSLIGRAVTLDLSALRVSAANVDGVWYDLAGPMALQLMPGQHWVYAQGVYTYFTVNADGTLDYDASLDGALAGRGTTSLSLVGRAVTLDLSALGVSTANVDGVWLDLAGPTALQLMPGQHWVYAQGVFTYFTVNADGTLDYDASLDGALAGRGTTTLTFLVP